MVTICKNEVFKWCKPGLICIICNILTQLQFQIGVPFTRETYLHEVLSHGQVYCEDNNFTIFLKCRYGVNITRLISIDLTSLKFCHQCHTLAPTFIEVAISTYKFKRAFFRHDRRTAPKFGTHVRIETRLALTKKIDQPHPRGVYGVIY